MSTDLDLDDVAATSAKAKKELAQTRAASGIWQRRAVVAEGRLDRLHRELCSKDNCVLDGINCPLAEQGGGDE